jgi:uncharacterized protein
VKIEKVEIPIMEGEKVSGMVCAPDMEPKDKLVGIIVAHGAANDMNEPMIATVCEGLARKNAVTLRFNFSYREKGKKSPDSQGKLEETWLSVFEFFAKSLNCEFDAVIVAGKSMGGRVVSQLVSSKRIKADGLILLGYPLHAHGKKDSLRDAHLYDIDIPMLFVEGTRDTLCDLSLLRGVLEKLQTSWDLKVIEGGDHSFHVPESMKIPQEKIYETILEKCGDWIAEGFRA